MLFFIEQKLSQMQKQYVEKQKLSFCTKEHGSAAWVSKLTFERLDLEMRQKQKAQHLSVMEMVIWASLVATGPESTIKLEFKV